MKEQDIVNGVRYRIPTVFGKAYFFVSEQDIFMTVPEENFPKHAELRGVMEALCRVTSKGMKEGLPLQEVAEQIRKADMGRSSILKHMASSIKKFVELSAAVK
jgi:hypothetical protein